MEKQSKGQTQVLSDEEQSALAEAVRQACIQTALDAYEQGGLAGLCAEGRWEMAIDALRTVRLDELPKGSSHPSTNDQPNQSAS